RRAPRDPHDLAFVVFFFSSRRRHTICYRDWSSDVCSSDLPHAQRVVRLIELDQPHDTLSVRVADRVAVKRDALPAADTTPPWEEIGRASCRDRVWAAAVGRGVNRSTTERASVRWCCEARSV